MNTPEPPDQEHLGIVELFESLRGRLIIYFEVRHAVDPEELADETLKRVLEKLCGGAKVADLGPYCFGVARNVFHEYLRDKKKLVSFIDEHRYQGEPIDDEDEAVLREQRLACLEDCMRRLKERDRTMLLDYYRYKGRLKLDQRKRMADEMKITREVLALRVFHLKQKLKKCVSERLKEI